MNLAWPCGPGSVAGSSSGTSTWCRESLACTPTLEVDKYLPLLPRQGWGAGCSQRWGELSIGGGGWRQAPEPQGTSPPPTWLVCAARTDRPGPPDHRHLIAQVDEEAALEQAMKFCQVHLGAAAQRQVSPA